MKSSLFQPIPLSLLLIFTLLLGCETARFELRVTASPSEEGMISPSEGTFKNNEEVTLNATPSNGWNFVRWEGDWSGTTNPTTVRMTRDYNIIAVFERDIGEVVDIDGNVYKTVQIVNQLWMAENLRTSKYRDGSPIPNVTDNSQWGSLSTGAWIYYDNQEANDAIYGKLYNWFAVSDTRNLCPTGWNVPTDPDWSALSNHLGTNPGHKMKSSTGWVKNGNGSNESGFKGLPGGYRGMGGIFSGESGSYGSFWSSTQDGTGNAWYRYLNSGNRDLGRSSISYWNGQSIRCIRD